MQIVIPMAGLGRRFLDNGYKEPKPLILIEGKPVIEHLVNLFPGEQRFIFIANEKHLRESKLRAELKRIKPGAEIVAVPVHNLGPVHSVLLAQERLEDSLPTLVVYCDIFLNWDFKEFERQMRKKKYDAALVAFKGFHPALVKDGFYASIKASEQFADLVEEVREKASFTENKMDSWNSAGVYYFKSGALVKKYFQELIDKKIRVNNEYYVSMVHNLLTRDGLKNGIYPVDFFISWGKPEDVREYQYWSKHFNK